MKIMLFTPGVSPETVRLFAENTDIDQFIIINEFDYGINSGTVHFVSGTHNTFSAKLIPAVNDLIETMNVTNSGIFIARRKMLDTILSRCDYHDTISICASSADDCQYAMQSIIKTNSFHCCVLTRSENKQEITSAAEEGINVYPCILKSVPHCMSARVESSRVCTVTVSRNDECWDAGADIVLNQNVKKYFGIAGKGISIFDRHCFRFACDDNEIWKNTLIDDLVKTVPLTLLTAYTLAENSLAFTSAKTRDISDLILHSEKQQILSDIMELTGDLYDRYIKRHMFTSRDSWVILKTMNILDYLMRDNRVTLAAIIPEKENILRVQNILISNGIAVPDVLTALLDTIISYGT